MRRKSFWFVFLVAIFSVFIFANKSYAGDLDKIENYVVTVDPRMNDGSLDITYEIKWKVLDSTTEGPLTWVQIGTPNEYFYNATALTGNIKTIEKYNGSYVKIVFNKAYSAGESLTFKYKIHQNKMYKMFLNTCSYSFTPAWFTDCCVDKLTIRWNADQVISNNSSFKDDNYLVWTKTNMGKGEKLQAKIKYKKNAFSGLTKYNQRTGNMSLDGNSGISTGQIIMWCFILIIVIWVISIILSINGAGYYGHRGFYGRYYSYYPHWYHDNYYYHNDRGPHGGGCVSSAGGGGGCACACAGSGRAGCSKKDFYGTKLTSKKIEDIFEKKNK